MSGGDGDPAEVIRHFREAVNMSVAELRAWLDTPQSGEVGWTHEGEAESVGHHAGREILALLGKPKGFEPDKDELAWMRKVVGYVRRHSAQGPAEDVEHSRWRYSLMNWGHDPLRDGRGSGKAGSAPTDVHDADGSSSPKRPAGAAKRSGGAAKQDKAGKAALGKTAATAKSAAPRRAGKKSAAARAGTTARS